MNEGLMEEVMRRVRQELSQKPRALLLGDEPQGETGFTYVTGGEYSAVVIGSMTAMELLSFPDERSLTALLEGKPVYLWEQGQRWKQYAACSNRALWSRLLSARRQMQQWGVKPMGKANERLLTAHEVERRLRAGLPVEGRLTPLARDILEGKQ